MKKSIIYLLFIVSAGFPVLSLSREGPVTKVGEWGTGRYEAVFVRGNYAYCVAHGAGLDIIDVGDPSGPRKVGNHDTTGEAEAVHVSGNYAYVGGFFSWDRGSFEIIDISNPSAPVRVGEYAPPGSGVQGVHVNGNYAYLAAGNGGLQVVDISTPSNPVQAGITNSPRNVNDVVVKGNYAYVTADSRGFQVVDISDPSNPTPVGKRITSGRMAAVHISGNYAYVIDLNHGFSVIDISTPGNPKKVGYYECEAAKDVYVSGNYAYAANDSEGLVVVDISNPSTPVYAGKYGTDGEARGVCVNGDYAYVADDYGGLRVIDVSNPSTPFESGYYNTSGYALDVRVKGNYAFLADSESGLQIIDVSEPSNPSRTAVHKMDGGTGSVCVSGNYAYTGTGDQGLRIIDISNPSRPVPAGYCSTPGGAFDVDVDGNYAYVAGCSGGLYIIDVSDPSNPTTTANILSGGDLEAVTKNGNYVYAAIGFQNGALYVVDVSNPSSPTVVGSHSLLNLAGLGIYVGGDYAYVANTSFFIFDISDPFNPATVVENTIYSLSGGVFVADGYAYVTEYYDGLMVFDVSDPSSLVVMGNTNTPGIGYSVYVGEDYVYTADGPSGKLLIFSKVPASTPRIGVNPKEFFFSAESYGVSTGPQTLFIDNSGGGSLDWSVSPDREWLNGSPVSGTNAGTVSVSVDATGLEPGTYTGTLSISAANASNSPKTVDVTLTVYKKWETEEPFGEFTTPVYGSTVSGSVPFTGWALDDIGVKGVALYRENGGTLTYIGDAVFVEGARPDVETAYPGYPMNSRAGWGYMLLTHFLPGSNGTFTIIAVASDLEGNRVELGGKTIVVDNANAKEPFGAIDTPAQGGTASGGDYINYGWVLTPRPNTIPMDGSTIRVYVDGVELGNPAYDLYREDIAALFPGYSNSGGAVGYFSLDTTRYENGTHIIHWTAEDDAGNSDGIGSRYFEIRNARGAGRTKDEGEKRYSRFEMMSTEQETPRAVLRGSTRRVVGELERVVLDLAPADKGFTLRSGYLEVNGRRRKLPVGSTLDTERGRFLWQPGPGFVGPYEFVFIFTDARGNERQEKVSLTIKPKF